MKTYEEEYFVPESGVLKNKLGLQDAGKLRRYEYYSAADRAKELQSNPIKGDFDLEHLKKIHKHLFNDIYEWAGEPRSVDIAKRVDERNQSEFADPDSFGMMDLELQQTLKDCNRLKGCTQSEAALAMTKTYLVLNAMHPFPEGNGRATQIFMRQLAKEAGFEIDFAKVDKKEWNKAAAASMPQYDIRSGEQTKKGDVKPILTIFNNLVKEQSKQIEPESKGPER
jgi:cell filamentation protein